MKPATKVVLVTLGVVAAVGACSRALVMNHQAEAPHTPRQIAASQIAEGHAAMQQQRFDKAIDSFLKAARYSGATSEAVSGAVEAMNEKVSGSQLPDQLKEAGDLWKRLPPTANREALRVTIQHYLLDTVTGQTRQAGDLLANRRKFVDDMYNNDQGDVRATDASGSILTKSQVVSAESRMRGLQQPYALMALLFKHEAVAKALERFATDDREVLATETVSDSGLAELEEANSQLADALWPVQRRLDRLRPGWRTQ